MSWEWEALGSTSSIEAQSLLSPLVVAAVPAERFAVADQDSRYSWGWKKMEADGS